MLQIEDRETRGTGFFNYLANANNANSLWKNIGVVDSKPGAELLLDLGHLHYGFNTLDDSISRTRVTGLRFNKKTNEKAVSFVVSPTTNVAAAVDNVVVSAVTDNASGGTNPLQRCLSGRAGSLCAKLAINFEENASVDDVKVTINIADNAAVDDVDVKHIEENVAVNNIAEEATAGQIGRAHV